MNLHKDKFISETLYRELRGLEVKKNGRVEHSDLGHDDQIFSYLMAIYVWYDGKNLRENFGIEKGSIKTEEDVDDVLEMATAAKNDIITKDLARVTRLNTDDTAKLEQQIMMMKKAQGIMYSDFVKQQRMMEQQRLIEMLKHDNIKQAYANKFGVNAEDISIEDNYSNGVLQNLPPSLFLDFNKNEEELDQMSIYNNLNAYDYNRNNSEYDDSSLQ
jgi:hypothetical protein